MGTPNPSKPYDDQEVKITKAAEKPPTTLALLHTRCGCSQVIEIPIPVPKTVTVELAPIPGDEKAVRVFYAAGKQVEVPGPEPRSVAFVYLEGPNPAPRIIVPGVTGTAGTPASRLLK